MNKTKWDLMHEMKSRDKIKNIKYTESNKLFSEHNRHSALQFEYIVYWMYETPNQSIFKAIIEYINKFNTKCSWTNVYECIILEFLCTYEKLIYIYYWIFHSMRRIDEKCFVHLLCAKHNNRAQTHKIFYPHFTPLATVLLLSKTAVITEI